MPQFDAYSWLSVCLWLLITFHLVYIFMLQYVYIPITEIVKFRQKISTETSSTNVAYLAAYYKKNV